MGMNEGTVRNDSIENYVNPIVSHIFFFRTGYILVFF